MEIANFEIDNDLLPIKDATARQAAADVLVVAERAEGKADDAQTVADRAEGKADDALTGLVTKQKSLNNGTFKGDIDTLVNDVDMNGYYFVHATEATGTHPGTGYYMLLVFGALQLAVTAKATTVYFYARTYVNGAWSYWRKVQLTT